MVNLNFCPPPLTHGAQAAPFLQGLLAVQALSGRKPPELKWDYHQKHHLTSPVRSLQAIGRFISALCRAKIIGRSHHKRPPPTHFWPPSTPRPLAGYLSSALLPRVATLAPFFVTLATGHHCLTEIQSEFINGVTCQ